MDASSKITDKEICSLETSFVSSSQYQCIETNKKGIMTRLLKHWNKNKPIAQLSTCVFYLAETVAMKIY